MRTNRVFIANCVSRPAIALACAILLTACQSVPPPKTETPSTAANALQAETLVRKFWDAFNRAAWNELDALVAPTFAHHPLGKTLTLAQFKSGGGWVHRGMANYTLTIDSLVASESDVAIRWTARGTHVGSFFGEPPTNREINVQGMHFHAIANGRISEDWEVIDFDGFKEQLRRP